jgi:hypothetical protein
MKWNRSKPMKYLNRKKSFAKMWQDGVQSSPADFAHVSSNYLKGWKITYWKNMLPFIDSNHTALENITIQIKFI